MTYWMKFLFIMGMLGATLGFSQEHRIRGYVFGDFYYILRNHKTPLQGQNGFWIRRIYITYDKAINASIDVRLRLEMASPGDFSSQNKLTPFVKDAYMRWKIKQYQVIIGISPTPTLLTMEKVWGYRPIEKTPMDLHKWAQSRDFGVAIKGTLTKDSPLQFHLMFANGSGIKSENNKGKKLMGAVGYFATPFILEIYADYEILPNAQHVATFQALTAYQSPRWRMGVQYAHQNRKTASTGPTLNFDLISFFSAAVISEKMNAFFRFDKTFDANPYGESVAYIPFDPTAPFFFTVGGLDFQASTDVHVMPNIEIVIYEKNHNGVTPGNDLIPRLTLFYRF